MKKRVEYVLFFFMCLMLVIVKKVQIKREKSTKINKNQIQQTENKQPNLPTTIKKRKKKK